MAEEETKKGLLTLDLDGVQAWLKERFGKQMDKFKEVKDLVEGFPGDGKMLAGLNEPQCDKYFGKIGSLLYNAKQEQLKAEGVLVNKELAGLEAKIDQLLEPIQTVSQGLKLISKEVVTQKRKRLDCWTASKRSKDEQAGFKNELIDYYERGDSKHNDELYCMVLNRQYPREKVRASHIWKFATHGEGLDEFGLKSADVRSPRNGLLLSEALEAAFDNRDVCFIYNPIKKAIQVFVLNPEIKGNLVSPSTTKTFNDIDGEPLHGKKMPFRRLLAWHAKLALEHALARGWIDSVDKQGYATLLELSEDAHFPGDDIERQMKTGSQVS
jgi:hypothetical protein